MQAELKKFFEYQWELTMIGAQLDEKILRGNFNITVEGNLKGLSRSIILTAANIKYELTDLENKCRAAESKPYSGEEVNQLVLEKLRTIEIMLFQSFKGFIQLLASMEKEQGLEAPSAMLKEFWPKLAEIYQFFRNYHSELKGIE
ncbi:MAG TPA: hypothetical protein VLH37_07655 [Bacteroidales bacterium]|nr:hypothetical protein [Bacteroidales bacterium]